MNFLVSVIVKCLGLETWKGIKTTVRLAKKTMLDTITEYEYLPLLLIRMVEVTRQHLADSHTRQCGCSSTYLADGVTVAFWAIGCETLVSSPS